MKKSFISFVIILTFCSAGWVDTHFSVAPSVAWQGKVIVVKLVLAEGISNVKGQFLNQEFGCYKAGDVFRGIVGVPTDQKVGKYDLTLVVTKGDGRIERMSKRVKVWSTKFPFSKFWLKPAKKKLLVRDLIQKEWAQIEKSLIFEYPVQHWKGMFSLPVEGRISQGFGHRQIINGKGAGSHRGMDIAIPSGTEIRAPNHGKVAFAKMLKAFGGTMVLDHGQGVHTLYFHLSKLSARRGETVEKGDIIALTGNSGISSGPHLHWGMSVHNLRVDPMPWVKYAF